MEEYSENVSTSSKGLKFCTCEHPIEEMKPDPRLLSWERNLEERQRIRSYLCEKTQRPNEQLLMNSLERHRKLQQHRQLLTLAQLPCKFDKYRGNPAWWKTPTQLHKRCGEPQNYFLHQSKLERNEVSQIEYIEVPNANEIHSPRKFVKDPLKCDSYCLRRLNSCTMRKIQPHKPDLSGFMIQGISLERDAKTVSSMGIFKHFFDQSSVTVDENVDAEVEPAKYLIINDQEITKKSNGVVQTSVIFDPSSIDETQTHYLYITNNHRYSLRISFQEISSEPSFANTRKDDGSVVRFFFNRNYYILNSKQKWNAPFWFRSPTVGFFEQTLRMKIVPDLWDGNLEIQVTLKASVTQADLFEKCLEYEVMIQNRVRDRLIKECMAEVLAKVVSTKKSVIRVYTYDKATIFEALNSTFDALHDRPRYLYDKEVVDELEAFYESVRLPQHPELWSLNLNDLRTVTKDRENFEKTKTLEESYEAILETVEMNKRARNEMRIKLEAMFHGQDTKGKKKGTPKSPSLMKKSPEKKSPAKSPENPKTKKKKDKEESPPPIVVEPAPKSLCDHLEDIIRKLKSPATTVKSRKSERLKLCYNLLCAYIDKIVEDIKEMLEDQFPLPPDARVLSKTKFNPSRIMSQTFASCNVEHEAFQQLAQTKDSQPQPEWSKEIPLEDFDARFEASGLKTLEKGKGKSKSKTKKLTSRKSSKVSSRLSETSRKRSTTASASSVAKTSVEEASKTPSIIEEEEPPEEPKYEIPPEKYDHYRNNIYVLIYANLCNFVEDLVGVFDVHPSSEISPDVLQRIKFSQTQPLQADPDLTVQVVNLKQKISEVLTWKPSEERVDLEDHVYYEPPDVSNEPVPKSSSVWDVLKAYYPVKSEPGMDYAQRMRESMVQDEPVTTDEEVAGEEGITERMIQTSLTSNINVTFASSTMMDKRTSKICICPPVDLKKLEDVKYVSSFYNSDCFKMSDDDAEGDSTSGTSLSDDDRVSDICRPQDD